MPVSQKATTTPSSSYYSLELDPLLSDLAEKKLSLRRSLAWLDAELKDAKIKLASKEQLLAQESENRKKFAESRARRMEEEMGERRDKTLKKLQSRLRLKQTAGDKQNLWESSGFRIVASISILTLAMLSKR